MSRGMGETQREIHWALFGAEGNERALRDLMREVGATDLPNFRRSVASMERTGKVETRLERCEDGVVRRIVRSVFWTEIRRTVRRQIEEDPDPVGSYPDELTTPADPHEDEEDVDPAKVIKELMDTWAREAAAPPEPEPDYGWLDELDLEKLRAALPSRSAEVHHSNGYTIATTRKRRGG